MKQPVVVILLVTLALILQCQSASAQSGVDKHKAKEHFSIGVELLDESPPDYQRALTQFTIAHGLSGSWKVLGNMGLCAHRLERDGEAADVYEQYLLQGGAEISAQERRDILRDLLAINANLSKVELSADAQEGAVIVKRTGSTAPAQVYPLREGIAAIGLRAGAYRITLQATEGEQTWPIVLKPKTRVAHSFVFEDKSDPVVESPAAVKGGVARPTNTTPRDFASDAGLSAWSTTGYVVGGLGLAAIGVGAFFGVEMQERQEAVKNDLWASTLCDGNRCPRRARVLFNEANNAATAANALFVTGGVLATAGLLMVLLGEVSSGDRVGSVQLVPVLHPNQVGLLGEGTF